MSRSVMSGNGGFNTWWLLVRLTDLCLRLPGLTDHCCEFRLIAHREAWENGGVQVSRFSIRESCLCFRARYITVVNVR